MTTLRGLSPTITNRPSDQLPLGSWLFIPKRRAAANADTSTTSLPSGIITPETLAAYLGVSLSTIYSWNSSGYGLPFVKLGNLIRYTYEDVELWLTRQLELSRGKGAYNRRGSRAVSIRRHTKTDDEGCWLWPDGAATWG